MNSLPVYDINRTFKFVFLCKCTSLRCFHLVTVTNNPFCCESGVLFVSVPAERMIEMILVHT